MDIDARRRLKAELAARGIKAKELSLQLGFAETYVSRLMSGDITEPSAKRVAAIEDATGIDWSYVLTGTSMSPQRRKLLNDLSTAPDPVIDDVIKFIKSSGLGQS